jgi:c-di-GMP-binding flagellar brake protein YcgR
MVDIRVRLRRWEEAEEAAAVVRSYELSEGGMSVYAPERLEMGSFVVVAFSLPPEENVMRIRAVVKYRRGFRCGLEFVDLSATGRMEIAKYLESLAGVSKS